MQVQIRTILGVGAPNRAGLYLTGPRYRMSTIRPANDVELKGQPN